MSFVDVPASHGHLEGLWWKSAEPRAAGVVCHPHPLHGGTMHNHITYRLAQTFRDHSISNLRFNFRGVGRSTGTHDQGVGEVDDVKVALDWVQAQEPNQPLLLGGFSFGCRAALKLATQDKRVERVLAVGLAIDIYDVEFIRELKVPAAFIHADKDEFGSVEKVSSFLKTVKANTRVFVLENSDHLATGRLDAFSAVAKTALEWLLEQ